MDVGIVDVSSVFYPAWHAGSDRPVGFAYGITLERIRRFAAQGFDLVVVACDWGRSFRHDLSPAYKAHRAEPDVGLVEQLRRVQEAADADGHRVLRVEGFEADDIIATVATWAAARGDSVEILSSDKDLLALVGPTVCVRGVQSNVLMDQQAVQDKWGVRPGQMADLLALWGDDADGVKGVPRVGKATGAKLLREYGSIDGIHAAMNAETITATGAVYQALAAAFINGTLDLDRKLVALRKDVPIDFDALLQPKAAREQRPDFGTDFPTEDTENMIEPQTEQRPDGTVVEVQQTIVAAQPEQDPVDRIMTQLDWTRGLEPRGLKDAVWVSRQLFESRLLAGPEARDGDLTGKSGYGSPEQILAVILAGRELGLGAMTSLRGINIIRGKVSMSAILMVGLCLARGAEYFDLVESTPERATYETKRRGHSRILTMTYTIEQAKSAGLYPGKRDRFGNPSQWEKDPSNMLAQRCGARAARAYYPHIVTGVYLPDELSDD